MTITFDPALGKFVIVDSGTVAPSGTALTLFTDCEILTCLMSVDYTARRVNALYPTPINGRIKPYVDAISLVDGRSGETVSVAMAKGLKYKASKPLLVGTDLFLGIDGRVTHIAPTLSDGVKWKVKIGRVVNEYEFIFDPQEPEDLTATPGGGGGNPVPIIPTITDFLDRDTDAGTCYRLNDFGKAYTIKSTDAILPYIDGLTIESGVENQEVKVARNKGQRVTLQTSFTTSSTYYLGQDGKITKVVPSKANGDNFFLVVGRSIGNSNFFIYDPGTPVKLA